MDIQTVVSGGFTHGAYVGFLAGKHQRFHDIGLHLLVELFLGLQTAHFSSVWWFESNGLTS